MFFVFARCDYVYKYVRSWYEVRTPAVFSLFSLRRSRYSKSTVILKGNLVSSYIYI